MEDQLLLENKKSKPTMGVNRSMNTIKSLMEKREDQRGLTIYYMANVKYQSSLIVARQMLYTSQKIWRQFDDDFKQQFEQAFFFRTSKNKELTEYFLDYVLIAKVFLKTKKIDEIVELVEKIQLPTLPILSKQNLKTKQQILVYNEQREIQTRICACLSILIQILKPEKRSETITKLYHMLIEFVKTYYGEFEYATYMFQFANYYFETKQYQKAISSYNICIDLRKKNSLNEGFVDVLINSSICLKELGNLKEAIERTKKGIQIYRDLDKIADQNSKLDEYYLFIYKLYLEAGDFNEAYKNILVSYQLRSVKDVDHPKRIEIQLNLLFFYKTLERVINENLTQSVFNTKDRKQIDKMRKVAKEIKLKMPETILCKEQFIKYADFSSRLVHLALLVTQPFFDRLNAEQVVQLQQLLNKLSSYSFQKGLSELQKASFFQNTKTRQLLIEANPHILSNRSK